MDQPIAALLTDLEQRGLLDSTLVVWGGEFGRMPFSEGKGAPGRNHNPYGFCMWMAGGGVKGGRSYGETDEFGFEAVNKRTSTTSTPPSSTSWASTTRRCPTFIRAEKRR